MLKKVISLVSLWAIVTILFPTQVLAADIGEERLISSVTLSVAGATPNTFEPSRNHLLATSVSFDTANFGTQLQNSTGTVQVKQGTNLVKTLTSWTNAALPASVPTWNGRDIDNVSSAITICGSAGANCPDGDYVIEATVSYASGVDRVIDIDNAAFKVFTTPAVDVTSLSVNPTTFNPIAPQTADLTFTTSAAGFISVDVMDGTTVVKNLMNNISLAAGTYTKTQRAELAWDGRDSGNVLAPNKAYNVRVTSRQSATGNILDTENVSLTLSVPSTLAITTFNITTNLNGATFDPSDQGNNEDLTITYSINQAPDTVRVDIKDARTRIVRIFTNSLQNGVLTWNGEDSAGKIVPPGTYSAVMSVTRSGQATVTQTKTFTVAYNNTNKGDVTNFTISPQAFDPDTEDTTIRFNNTKDANITVEVYNSSGVLTRKFTSYQNSNYSSNSTHAIVWNGKDDGNSIVGLGVYEVIVTTRNNFGAVEKTLNVSVTNTGGSISSSNVHIDNISFKPSSKYEPGVDDDLEIEYDVKLDIDELKIVAVRGTEQIEISDEKDIEKEKDIQITWDGTDDNDDFVDDGTWRIEFRSKLGTSSLVAAKTITVEYEKPQIDDFFLSKKEFDNESDEFTFAIFRVDADASITIKVLEDGSEEDDVVEDMEVEKDKWYAVEWDGDSFSEGDDLDLKLIAENKSNEKIFDSEKVAVDIKEEDDSDNKADIIADYIAPVVTDGDQEMELGYELDDDGDVRITIHRGSSGSGTEIAELIDSGEQESGDHVIVWDSRDKSGKKLSDGIYSYKIVSQKTSKDTEVGIFVVGEVGEIDGGPSGPGSSNSNNNDDDDNSGGNGPNVIIDGGNGGSVTPPPVDDNPPAGGQGKCAGFSDVSESLQYCEAIQWAKDSGVFQGYSDGTFRPFAPINRAEILKVIMEALGIGPNLTATGNLGFKDVKPGEWYVGYIKAAKDLGIFSGDAGKATARPADTVNRAEALKLALEAIKAADGLEISTCVIGYSDVPVGVWYYKYACGSQKYELFDGSNLFPASLSTRAEMAEMLYRLYLKGLI